MSKPKRKMVEVIVEDYFGIYGSLSQLCDTITRWKMEYGEEYSNLRIDERSDLRGYDTRLVLLGLRLENDKEYAQRMKRRAGSVKAAKTRKAKKEVTERTELARLQKKYPEGGE